MSIYHNITSTASLSQNQTCNVEVTYSVCLDILVRTLQSMDCDIDPEGGVLVQQNQESTANQLVSGLRLIKPSPECQRVALPFFCFCLGYVTSPQEFPFIPPLDSVRRSEM